MDQIIYLDNNATTPLDARVLESMMPYLTQEFGNASSLTHRFGRRAHEAIQEARVQVSDLLGASPDEILFTSGATESVNTALKGVFEAYSRVGKHFVTCVSEHKSVLDTFAYLERKGAIVTYLEVDGSGEINLDELRNSIRADTVMVALMAANNETGVCHPIESIAEIAREKGVLFFCDATQWIGKQGIDLQKVPIDILAMSAHKLYGPKGVGALFVRRKSKRTVFTPLFHGGSQENHHRAGTYNVPGIVGLGQACHIAVEEMEEERARLAAMKFVFESNVSMLPEVQINGAGAPRLAHVSNVTFKYLRASEVMTHLPYIALSAGSACVSGDRDPSHVLLGMGLGADEVKSTLRFSFGRFNTDDECQTVIASLRKCISDLRDKSPIWQLFTKGML